LRSWAEREVVVRRAKVSCMMETVRIWSWRTCRGAEVVDLDLALVLGWWTSSVEISPAEIADSSWSISCPAENFRHPLPLPGDHELRNATSLILPSLMTLLMLFFRSSRIWV
jgi:hypothetical protein